MLWATLLFLFSCQKEEVRSNSNDQLISKVNSWLDSRKPAQKLIQAENVELLKTNLEFSDLRIEQSAEGEKIIVIPVKENFKTIKNIDKASIPNLVLILDKMGNVRKGNIVLFYPQAGQAYSKVPDNTFYNILNTSKPECNGKFRYLSVTGKRLHELEYENDRMKSFAHAKDSAGTSTSRVTFCVDWYWVTTVYDEWGNILNQSWDYYTSTCQGEDCEDPYNAMLCPMDNSSGGGYGDMQGWEFAVEKAVNWVVVESPSMWWYVKSYETLKGEKVAGEPLGGHFTGNIHDASTVFNPQQPGWASWQELQKSSQYSDALATTIISGKVTFPSAPDEDVNNKQKNWASNAVFP